MLSLRLKPETIACIHHAREILLSRLENPPSILELTQLASTFALASPLAQPLRQEKEKWYDMVTWFDCAHQLLSDYRRHRYQPKINNCDRSNNSSVLAKASTGNSDAEKALQQLQTQPLWSKLKVVKQGKVYVLGRYWVCCGAIAANRVIDDLFKYLIPLSIDEKLPSK